MAIKIIKTYSKNKEKHFIECDEKGTILNVYDLKGFRGLKKKRKKLSVWRRFINIFKRK